MENNQLNEEEVRKEAEKIVAKRNNPDKVFQDRRILNLTLAFALSCGGTVLSFYYLPVLFGFTIGFVAVFLSLILMVWIDEIFWSNNTIKAIGENQIATAIIIASIIYLFTFGFEFGNKWIDNGYASEERSSISNTQTTDSTTSNNDVGIPERTGTAQREQ